MSARRRQTLTCAETTLVALTRAAAGGVAASVWLPRAPAATVGMAGPGPAADGDAGTSSAPAQRPPAGVAERSITRSMNTYSRASSAVNLRLRYEQPSL